MAAVAFPKDSKTIKLPSGTTYSYLYIPAKEAKPTLLFLHGFPSSCYDWHNQITHFSKEGYGVLAPDLFRPTHEIFHS
jgi:pimeloyl-ACP methyl ester carboxylesterase